MSGEKQAIFDSTDGNIMSRIRAQRTMVWKKRSGSITGNLNSNIIETEYTRLHFAKFSYPFLQLTLMENPRIRNSK